MILLNIITYQSISRYLYAIIYANIKELKKVEYKFETKPLYMNGHTNYIVVHIVLDTNAFDVHW